MAEWHMTDQEATDRATKAARSYYSDNLLGRVASAEAIEVAKIALLAYAEEREHRRLATVTMRRKGL